MITKNGTIKKTSLEAYSRPRVNGINAIEIREDDQLLGARLTDGTSEIMIATKMVSVSVSLKKSKISRSYFYRCERYHYGRQR